MTRIMEGKENYKYSAKELREISNIHASDAYKADEALNSILAKCLDEANKGSKCACVFIYSGSVDENVKKISEVYSKYEKTIIDSLKSLGYKISFSDSYISGGKYMFIHW